MSFNEIKDTSIVAIFGSSYSNKSVVACLKFVFSLTTTRGSFLNFQTSWFVPTSTAYTRFALFCKAQSVKPPVEDPISTITRSVIVISKYLRAFSSFKPPRET